MLFEELSPKNEQHIMSLTIRFRVTLSLKGGGAIYNDVTGVFEFLDESMATFTGNRASDSNGGAVRNNLGGVITFKGGVIFTENYCEFNGGAIGNSGSLR